MNIGLFELYNLYVFVAGVAILGLALLPRFISDLPISDPLLYITFGFLLFSLPIGLPSPDPLAESVITERLTEVVVIIALMTGGLKVDRPPGLQSWSGAWRLVGIAMPLTIGLVALLGWGVGLSIPAAVLLGAVIAPTDPVIASELQLERPGGSRVEGATDREENTRHVLTTEAGLNDGLAFPFTYLAIAMALVGVAPGNWIAEWTLIDVLYRIIVGTLGGIVFGWILAKLVFFREVDDPLGRAMLGLEALGGTFAVYGVIELLGGYGFIGVFIAATVLRDYERKHAYYDPMHDLSEKSEQLLQITVMTLFGGAIAGGLLSPLSLELLLVAVVIVFLVRPLAGMISLVGSGRSQNERLAISFFGIRGIGTFYYLAYGLNHAFFRDPAVIWALAGTTVLISASVIGVTATPIIENRLGESS